VRSCQYMAACVNKPETPGPQFDLQADERRFQDLSTERSTNWVLCRISMYTRRVIETLSSTAVINLRHSEALYDHHQFVYSLTLLLPVVWQYRELTGH